MNSLVILIPLLPFIAALIIGLGQLSGLLRGEASESTTALIALWTCSMSCLLAFTLLGTDLLHKNASSFLLGQWLSSETLNIDINFITHGFSLVLAALFSLLLVIILRFSINYMHREIGFHRFFFVLTLFASAIQLLVLSGNTVGTFCGWEIAGLCSYLLILYTYNRPVAALNATHVFVTNRIGDASFILGISLSYAWAETTNWLNLRTIAAQLSTGEATGIAISFAIAAFAKSAQLPFTPWLARAMEGPTPSSSLFYGAVMIHSGVYLVCLLEPVFDKAPLAMALLVFIGGLTALYSYLVGLTQTDVKSSLVYATSGQLGLLFLECGLGFWQFAKWHLCAHAIIRTYSFLTAPSLMHNVYENPQHPVSPTLAKQRWAYTASLQRFWLDQLTDWTLIRPIRRLAHDLHYFDDQIVDQLTGITTPAINSISSLAELEEKLIGAHLDNHSVQFSNSSGVVGKITELFAGHTHWFEDRFVLGGLGKGTINVGRKLGQGANKIELLVLRPRYLVIFVLITLSLAF